MTQEQIIAAIRDSARGAGLDPDHPKVQAMLGNVAMIWLMDAQWLERRQWHFRQLTIFVKGLDDATWSPAQLPTVIFETLVRLRATADEIDRLDTIDTETQAQAEEAV